MKIDLVYLWVDGSDISWFAKRNEYLPKENQRDLATFCEGRIADNDELKSSLRSVEMYAPWINKIYIVTDNQIPKWLDTSNDRIKIIDQNTIIPQKYLPTFNSVVIEHCLANIPELSECFLLANDDMMFNRRVEPSFFFTKEGKPIVRFDKLLKRSYYKYVAHTELLYSTTINKVGEAISRDFNNDYFLFRPHHQIDAYTKSSIRDCLDKYNDWHKLTLGNRFRTKDDMQRHIFSLYVAATGNAKIKYQYPALTKRLDKLLGFFGLNRMLDSCYFGVQELDYDKCILRHRPALICFNDGEAVNPQDRTRLRKFLSSKYPLKSQFEK